jgi:hypothetical protein
MITSIHKLFILTSLLVILFLIFQILYVENGYLELRQLKKDKKTFIIENSKLGLELIDQINIFKRLAKNDLELIEHIARTELNMLGQTELIFVPEIQNKFSPFRIEDFQTLRKFRLLTESEFEELLNFNINSFKFYDDLQDDRKDPDAALDSPSVQLHKGVDEKRFSEGHQAITIQVAAFKNRKDAIKMVNDLQKKGYASYLITSKSTGGTIWHKVRVGNFRDMVQAHKMLEVLKKESLRPIILKR